MTTVQFCTFELGSLLLGLEAKLVQEVLRAQPVTEVPLAPHAVRGLMNMRGQIVLVVDLRRRLGLPEPVGDVRRVNVLVRTEDGLVSLLVDRVGDVLEISPEEFEAVPDTLDAEARQLLRGAYQLPERLLLQLDAQRAAAI
ncbi:MAG TPA: chemotaxis protein CheW [Polyangiaceae bacterium]|nr:chemotaxis protein CheW [Polyangiaceae bacterium]